MAALIAVNCPEPSAATVMAVRKPVDVADEATDNVEDFVGTTDDSVVLLESPWAKVSPNRAAKMKDRITKDDLFER
jgi:hypothetical protein